MASESGPATPHLVVQPLHSEARIVRHGRLVRPATAPVPRAAAAARVGLTASPPGRWMVVLPATLTAAAGLATLADWLPLGSRPGLTLGAERADGTTSRGRPHVCKEGPAPASS